jgi:ferritin-like metal-binding protein YciE
MATTSGSGTGTKSDSSKMPMQTPQDLFVHELSDIHSAEQIIVKMLDQAQGMVQNTQLKDDLKVHADQTREHVKRVERSLEILGAKRHPVTCHAMQGMMEEMNEAKKSNPSKEVMEGIVAGGAAKTEHYEIAAYTSLIEMARAMGQREIQDLLSQNQQDEEKMLLKVNKVGAMMSQQMASTMGSQQGQQSQRRTAM